MRRRLRERYSDDELMRIYESPHQHSQWADHKLRVSSTIALARWASEGATSASDLSAGDATIINALDLPDKYIGDFAPGYDYTGAIEQTIDEIPQVNLFICSETIEHLDDPDMVLRKIRQKSNLLILSTPIDESDADNPEHYWGWGVEDVEQMLRAAKWEPTVLQTITFHKIYHYDYQLWLCR